MLRSDKNGNSRYQDVAKDCLLSLYWLRVSGPDIVELLEGPKLLNRVRGLANACMSRRHFAKSLLCAVCVWHQSGRSRWDTDVQPLGLHDETALTRRQGVGTAVLPEGADLYGDRPAQWQRQSLKQKERRARRKAGENSTSSSGSSSDSSSDSSGSSG